MLCATVAISQEPNTSLRYLRVWGHVADGRQVLPGLRLADTSRGEKATSVNGFVTRSYNEEEYQAIQLFYERSNGESRTKPSE